MIALFLASFPFDFRDSWHLSYEVRPSEYEISNMSWRGQDGKLWTYLFTFKKKKRIKKTEKTLGYHVFFLFKKPRLHKKNTKQK